jgi:ribose 5-phosphate isomerase B
MIYIATDHAGYQLKEVLKQQITDLGYQVTDMGTFSEESCDYPDFIIPAAQKVAEDLENNLGIVLGGSGNGEAIVANKVPGIRAAVYNAPQLDIIALSKEHNNANVLSLGARFISEEEAKEAVKLWLAAPFPGEERHSRRIGKITAYEEQRG